MATRYTAVKRALHFLRRVGNCYRRKPSSPMQGCGTDGIVTTAGLHSRTHSYVYCRIVAPTESGCYQGSSCPIRESMTSKTTTAAVQALLCSTRRHHLRISHFEPASSSYVGQGVSYTYFSIKMVTLISSSKHRA